MIQIETTSHDPFFNQAFEDYVFRTYREGDVLLLWRNRPAVVVGCYQNICREVHVRALLDRGIPVVRRMSGGKDGALGIRGDGIYVASSLRGDFQLVADRGTE